VCGVRSAEVTAKISRRLDHRRPRARPALGRHPARDHSLARPPGRRRQPRPRQHARADGAGDRQRSPRAPVSAVHLDHRARPRRAAAPRRPDQKSPKARLSASCARTTPGTPSPSGSSKPPATTAPNSSAASATPTTATCASTPTHPTTSSPWWWRAPPRLRPPSPAPLRCSLDFPVAPTTPRSRYSGATLRSRGGHCFAAR
jgi:hypothetical protein